MCYSLCDVLWDYSIGTQSIGIFGVYPLNQMGNRKNKYVRTSKMLAGYPNISFWCASCVNISFWRAKFGQLEHFPPSHRAQIRNLFPTPPPPTAKIRNISPRISPPELAPKSRFAAQSPSSFAISLLRPKPPASPRHDALLPSSRRAAPPSPRRASPPRPETRPPSPRRRCPRRQTMPRMRLSSRQVSCASKNMAAD